MLGCVRTYVASQVADSLLGDIASGALRNVWASVWMRVWIISFFVLLFLGFSSFLACRYPHAKGRSGTQWWQPSLGKKNIYIYILNQINRVQCFGQLWKLQSFKSCRLFNGTTSFMSFVLFLFIIWDNLNVGNTMNFPQKKNFQWLRLNKVSLNLDKTHYMIFTISSQKYPSVEVRNNPFARVT